MELGRLLMTYSGPEPGRVRTAIVKLAKDDLDKMARFVSLAQNDYRDILRWADIQDEEDRKKAQLGGLTVNERLAHLELFSDWDAAVASKNRQRATAILQKCAIPDSDIEAILDAEFGA